MFQAKLLLVVFNVQIKSKMIEFINEVLLSVALLFLSGFIIMILITFESIKVGLFNLLANLKAIRWIS